MSLRRAPAAPVGQSTAAPAEASPFERALVKQAVDAHLGSMTRRMKREPISQLAPGARGPLKTTFLASANNLIALQKSTATVNPWLAEFRRNLLEAQREALKDDDNLRKEINDYQQIIEDLRNQLTQSNTEDRAERDAQIAELKKQLLEEQKQVAALVEELKSVDAEEV